MVNVIRILATINSDASYVDSDIARSNNNEMKNKRNKLERKLDEYNHTMELVRTILPVVILGLLLIILVKII